MTGWHGNRFILSSEIIGEGNERVIYQGPQRATKAYQQKGILTEWQDYIARSCVGKPALLRTFCLGSAITNSLCLPNFTSINRKSPCFSRKSLTCSRRCFVFWFPMPPRNETQDSKQVAAASDAVPFSHPVISVPSR